MNRHWIRISFRSARLPFSRRKGRIFPFFTDTNTSGVLKIDTVHGNGGDDGQRMFGKRDKICPETIVTNIPYDIRYEINGIDSTKEIKDAYSKESKGKMDFDDFLSERFPLAVRIKEEKYSDARFPFKKHCVSNMLISMAGGLPVPTYHMTADGRKRDKRFDEIAENGYVSLTTMFRLPDEDPEFPEFITETVSFVKSQPSNKAGCAVSWRVVKGRMGDDKFRELLQVMSEYSGFSDVMKSYPNASIAYSSLKDKKGFKEDLKKRCKCGAIDDTFLRPTAIDRFGAVSERTSPKEVLNFNGEFVFCVSDEIFEAISHGTKCATFLDGGLATLEKWTEYGVDGYSNDNMLEDLLEVDGFVKLKEVFDKKIELR